MVQQKQQQQQLAQRGSSDVQDRLKVRIHNEVPKSNMNGSGYNSAGATPNITPAISSAGSMQMENSFAHMQQPQFHKKQVRFAGSANGRLQQQQVVSILSTSSAVLNELISCLLSTYSNLSPLLAFRRVPSSST